MSNSPGCYRVNHVWFFFLVYVLLPLQIPKIQRASTSNVLKLLYNFFAIKSRDHMLSRSCKQCGGYHDQTSYSKNQWGKGVGQSRCNGCIHGGSTKLAGRAAETRRLNRSQRATFNNMISIIHSPVVLFAGSRKGYIQRGQEKMNNA